MSFVRFEEISVWRKAKELVVVVYKSMESCKDFSFRDQYCRAVVSIMNNIAEGYERRSNKDFKNFLYISKGSCGEVRSMNYLARDLGYITKSNYDLIASKAEEISKMLSGLIKVL